MNTNNPKDNIERVENSVRDLISLILDEQLGGNWLSKIGLSSGKLEKWKNRRNEEKKRQLGGTAETRLLYYADFYDLKAIIKSQWQYFEIVFQDKKTISSYLTILERYRDPNAHNREFFLYQEQLIAGVTGEIMTMILKYHSKKTTDEDCFPRIEETRDNLGNVISIGERFLNTNMILTPGNELSFIVLASDPEDLELLYRLKKGTEVLQDWQGENEIQYVIKEEDISKRTVFKIQIISTRDYHALHDCDDERAFSYKVLPMST